MKYKTFRAIVVSALVLLVGGGIFLGSRGHAPSREYSGGKDLPPSEPVAPLVSTPPPQAALTTPPAAPAAPATPLAEGEQAFREMDQAILGVLSQPMSGEKIKDAFSSRSYKVNIYRDSGFDKPNRLKIDLDRDEKDDEKWTLEYEGPDMKIKRQVSPGDDGNYPEEYRLVGGIWVLKK